MWRKHHLLVYWRLSMFALGHSKWTISPWKPWLSLFSSNFAWPKYFNAKKKNKNFNFLFVTKKWRFCSFLVLYLIFIQAKFSEWRTDILSYSSCNCYDGKSPWVWKWCARILSKFLVLRRRVPLKGRVFLSPLPLSHNTPSTSIVTLLPNCKVSQQWSKNRSRSDLLRPDERKISSGYRAYERPRSPGEFEWMIITVHEIL